LFHEYSAAFGSRMSFFETPILLILLRKINKIGVSKKVFFGGNAAKEFV
jgi:hypothetical protein